MALTLAALAVLSSSCAFTQWTEYYFFGSAGRRAVYENRVVTGIAILPFALVTDLVTFPIQGILLVIKGDDFLYKKPLYNAQGYAMAATKPTSGALAQFTPLERERIQLEARERIKALDEPGMQGATAFGIQRDGRLVELNLSPQSLEQARSRVAAEHIYPRASLASSCRGPYL